jgi:hypothetical protein
MRGTPTRRPSVPEFAKHTASPNHGSWQQKLRHENSCDRRWRPRCWRAILLMMLYCGPLLALSLSVNATGEAYATFSYSESPLVNTLVPPNPSTPISPDFFGMTIHHTATPFPPFPVSIFRFWDVVAWPGVEPTRGQFVWTRMDNTIISIKKNGVSDFIFTFGSVPAWASTNPSEACSGGGDPGRCAPPDMTEFDAVEQFDTTRHGMNPMGRAIGKEPMRNWLRLRSTCTG